MFTVFTGGSALSTKVKFTKVYAIIDALPKDSIYDIYLKLKKAILDGIKATKAGEAGFSLGEHGSYLLAFDSNAEVFKFMNDAISATGVNDEEQKRITFGIGFDSADYF